MPAENPYSAPVVDVVADAGSQVVNPVRGPKPPLLAVAKETFLAWEKLRLIYVGVLTFIVLALVSLFEPRLFGHLPFWKSCIAGAIFVNICYLAGPVTDTILSWVYFRSLGMRWTLFSTGLIIASFMAIVGTLVEIAFFDFRLD